MGKSGNTGLVRRAQQGDRRAFDALMRHEIPVVYSAAARVLAPADADDAVQETLISAFRNLKDLREPDKLRPWLLTIVMREARRQARDAELPVGLPAGSAESVPVDVQERAVAEVTLAEQRKDISAATPWLDPEDREMLALWWLELLGEVDRSGLVQAAGTSPNHVAVRLKRLRERLTAVRVLVRALAARDRPDGCAEFRVLLAGWPGRPSSVWRKRFVNHISQCPTCGALRHGLVPPELLLSTTALLVAPATLAAQPATAGAIVRVMDAGRRLLHAGKAGIAQPVAAVAATAAVLGGAAVVIARTGESRPLPSAQAPSTTSPRAPVAASVGVSVSPSGSGVVSASPGVSFQGPLTITKGGTYRGNWRSTDPGVPAVSIRTSEPVILQDCQVQGPGDLISARFSDRDAQTGIDLTVRDCRGTGQDPRITGKTRGFFVLAVWPKKIVVENNYFEHTRGVTLIGDNKPGSTDSIRVQRNQVRNVDGRVTGTSGCSTTLNTYPFPTRNGQCGANAIALNGFQHTRTGIDIGWNEIINTAGQSQSEDNINLSNSSGTAQQPIRIHDNYVQGAYPRNPATDASSGSGINIADSGTGVNPAYAPAFVHGENNQIVSTTNVGILIAAGHDNTLTGNRVISSGLLPDGRRMTHFFTGLYVWDCCYHHTTQGIWKNNTATGNTVGYTTITNNRPTRHDYKLDDCTPTCTANTSLPQPITPTTEHTEYQRWTTKTHTTNTTIGPRHHP
ncbi:RNA polymerase sigma factor rpoD [Actinoplanes sp. SE50]|nr:RNA polymerase sigma factor rpoD [Actinoplanes sp. SE50/110]ATO83190.1 RNA polymerase sigma factor rpoD [Actinoplanes sp. SE50]SLM00597.1 RNA polymerase sigma factor [Actinoplanes sp. SE50/110]